MSRQSSALGIEDLHTAHVAMQSASNPEPLGRFQVIGRLVVLALFLLPTAYVANLLSVAVHEVLGHGLTAWLVGGEFSGFQVNWDGGGSAYAFAPPGAPSSATITILACGPLIEAEIGILCLLLIVLYRGHYYLRTAFLLGAFFCLVNSSSYVFWSLYQHDLPSEVIPGATADFSRILQITGDPPGCVRF